VRSIKYSGVNKIAPEIYGLKITEEEVLLKGTLAIKMLFCHGRRTNLTNRYFRS
jgi:hypothetical protein